MMPTRLFECTLLLFLLATLVTAFNIKNILFGDSSSQDTNTQKQLGIPLVNKPVSNRADTPCSGYICKDTETCVKTPIECPCRSAASKKCIIGNWYTCIHPDVSCHDFL
ncbi:unnamed protein product [Rhizopus stolonifer]